jgi:hypothetical protein
VRFSWLFATALTRQVIHQKNLKKISVPRFVFSLFLSCRFRLTSFPLPAPLPHYIDILMGKKKLTKKQKAELALKEVFLSFRNSEGVSLFMAAAGMS